MANLLKFTQLISTFGATYNPGNASITLTALSALHTTAFNSQAAVHATKNTWKNASNSREIAFGPLDKLSTQLLGALESTNAPEQTISDMKSLVRKFRGDGKFTKADAGKTGDQTQAIPDPNAEPAVDNSKSNSQQSFDLKLEHFAKMILLLQSVPSYAPNEVAFQIPSLQALFTNLTTLNNAANISAANFKAARISRNLTFYAAGSGMLDRVRKSKSYIKSIYGAASQQYAAANAIKLVRVVSKKKAK